MQTKLDKNQREFYCTVKLDTDNKEKKTETKNIDDTLIYKEKFTFPIDSEEKIFKPYEHGHSTVKSVCEKM